MKKIEKSIPFLNAALVMITNVMVIVVPVSAQTATEESKAKPVFYFASGLSIGNVNKSDPDLNQFDKVSFPSLEGGVAGKHLSYGLVIGCENLFASSSSRTFYEAKASLSTSLADFNPYALFGIGAYIEDDFNSFIEYGFGFSYTLKPFGYFVQYSNWANSDYVTIGVIISLRKP